MKDRGTLTLGLFEKRIEGDDSLLELARHRFAQAGMGIELHAGTSEHLEWLLKFRPAPESPATLHLPREFNLLDPRCRERIAEFGRLFAGRLHGMIIHDHRDLAERSEDYVRAAGEMNALLEGAQGPYLFVEYAALLEPATFAAFFEKIRTLDRVSACIDIGHVGIRQAQRTYAKSHPGENICALKSQPSHLRSVMPEVDAAARSALPAVLSLIDSIAGLGKPMHFHLHDGHPLSAFSAFGVSDHLGFNAEIPLRFEYEGRPFAPAMFGRDGLFRIISKALQRPERVQTSFTLEIHPVNAQRPLGDAAPMFEHWRDKTNAEKMNHWLWILQENHRLLQEAVRET